MIFRNFFDLFQRCHTGSVNQSEVKGSTKSILLCLSYATLWNFLNFEPKLKLRSDNANRFAYGD